MLGVTDGVAVGVTLREIDGVIEGVLVTDGVTDGVAETDVLTVGVMLGVRDGASGWLIYHTPSINTSFPLRLRMGFPPFPPRPPPIEPLDCLFFI